MSRLHGHMILPQSDLQGLQYALGPVRHGKHPVPPLYLQGAALFLKKRFDFFRGKSRHGAVQEAAVPGNIFQHTLSVGVVGHVAPALACNEQLFTQPVIFFQQQDFFPSLCGGDGRKHSGGTATDHNAVNHPASHRPGTFPRSPPIG